MTPPLLSTPAAVREAACKLIDLAATEIAEGNEEIDAYWLGHTLLPRVAALVVAEAPREGTAFTRDDVEELREFAGLIRECFGSKMGGPLGLRGPAGSTSTNGAHEDICRSLADRIEGLLNGEAVTPDFRAASPPAAETTSEDTQRLDWLEEFTNDPHHDEDAAAIVNEAVWLGKGYHDIRATIDAARAVPAPDPTEKR